MNINKEQVDNLNVVISVQVSKDDYEYRVGEVLRDYRRKVVMPGFRHGKVPEGLIRKMYGKTVLIDEINKLVPEPLQNYIKEQNLKIIGEAMPRAILDDEAWEIGNDFTFEFELGLVPNIEINLSKEDHLPMYRIIIDQEMIGRELNNYASRFGQFVEVEAVTNFNEKLTGDIVQLGDDGQLLDDGLAAEDTMLLISVIRNEELKKPFENAKIGDEIVFNLAETFPNDWEIASILKKKEKQEAGNIGASLFKFTVKSVQRFVNAELTTELFDKIFGAGVITTLEEFENHIRKEFSFEFDNHCTTKFCNDLRTYILNKINPQLPEQFLYKWQRSNLKDISNEEFDKSFPKLMDDTKWEITVNSFAEQLNVKVDEEDLILYAKEAVRRQFFMYGLRATSEDVLTQHAVQMLQDEKTLRAMGFQMLERILAQRLIDIMDVQIQDVTLEEFNKILYGLNEPKIAQPEIIGTVDVTTESGEESNGTVERTTGTVEESTESGEENIGTTEGSSAMNEENIGATEENIGTVEAKKDADAVMPAATEEKPAAAEETTEPEKPVTTQKPRKKKETASPKDDEE